MYIPPLKNNAGGQRENHRTQEVRGQGIFCGANPGNWQNAISLGVFKTREAAQNYLHVLNTKGVHTARVGERASKIKTTIFILNKVDASAEEKLTAMQKDFAGSELRKVPCRLTR